MVVVMNWRIRDSMSVRTFFFFRQRAFGVHHVDGAVRHGFNDLADDAQGLAHFFNAHGKTVVAVSVFAYGDVNS